MDEAIAWGISLIFAFIVGIIFRSRSNRRTSPGTGSNVDRARDSVERAGDNVERTKDTNRRAADDNQRAQQLVGRAREILANAKHTDSSN